MEQEEIFDKIEAYLIGQMNDTERADFEKQIAADEDLKMDVAFQRLEHDAMKRLNEKNLRAKMAQWETDMLKKDSDSTQTPLTVVAKNEEKSDGAKVISLSTRWMRYAAAASVVLGVVLAGLWLRNEQRKPSIVETTKPTHPTDTALVKPTTPIEKQQAPVAQTPTKPIQKPKNKLPQTTSIPPQYNELLAYVETNVDEEEFKKSNTKRGNDNNGKDEWKPILEAYQTKNYDKALELLQKRPIGMTQQEWSGLIYFKLKNYDKAASYFKTLVNDPNAILGKERIEWNLALCYAAQYPSKAKELKDILNDILADKEHAHFEDANTLKNTYLK